MIFLGAGREEEDLLDRVAESELSKVRAPRASETREDVANKRPKPGTPRDDV
jgi:hypothetical protein